MRKNLFIGLFFFLIHINLFSATNENEPSVQIQYDAINNNNYNFSNNVLIQLKNKSIKGLIEWCQALTGQERYTLIFNKATKIGQAGINPDAPFEEQLQEIELQKERFKKEHPFLDYPMYEGVDLKNLFSEQNNLFQIQVNIDELSQIRISIKAIIPKSFETSKEDYYFYSVAFEYVYTLDLLKNDDSPNQRHYLVRLLEESIENFYLKNYGDRNKENPRAFLRQFKWKLLRINCIRNLRTIEIHEEHLPSNINGLFDL